MSHGLLRGCKLRGKLLLLGFRFLSASFLLFFSNFIRKIRGWSVSLFYLILIAFFVYFLLLSFLPLDPFAVDSLADDMNKSTVAGPFLGKLAGIDKGALDNKSNFILILSSEPIFSTIISEHSIFSLAMNKSNFLNSSLLNTTISDKLYDKKDFNLLFSNRSLFNATFFSNEINSRIIENTSVFSWDKIPGQDNGRLKEFLAKNSDLDWISNLEWINKSKIQKVNDGNVIKISNDTRNISLVRNDENNEVNLSIDGVVTEKFLVIKEDNESKIYKFNSIDDYYDNSILRNLTLEKAFGISYLRSLCYIEAAGNDSTVKHQIINDLYSNSSLKSLAISAVLSDNEIKINILEQIYNNPNSRFSSLSIIERDSNLRYQVFKLQHPYRLFFLVFIWHYWHIILALWLLFELAIWFDKARKVMEINDFSYDSKYSESTKKAGYDGIAALLSVRLNSLSRLYQSLNENRPIVSVAETNRPIPGAIRIGDVSDLTSTVFSDSSKLSILGFSITGSFINSLISWLIRRPRINGSLYDEEGKLILTANFSGEKGPLSWRVEPDNTSVEKEKEVNSLSKQVKQDTATIDHMVSELAYRIFSDLALEESHAVPWKATKYFSEGLRSYRDSLHGALDRRPKLLEAIRFFEKTLAEDVDHPWTHYNLGLAYTEMEISTSAEAYFVKAIHFHPYDWQPYYALAFNLYQRRNFDKAILLSSMALSFNPEYQDRAKIYDLMGLAHREEWMKSNRQLSEEYRDAGDCFFDAVKCSLIGLQSADNATQNERLNLAGRCIKDLASLLLEKGESRDAELLLDLATNLLPNDPSLHMALAEVCKSKKIDKSKENFRKGMDPSSVGYWAYLVPRMKDAESHLIRQDADVDRAAVDHVLNDFSSITADEMRQLEEAFRKAGNIQLSKIRELAQIKSVLENDENEQTDSRGVRQDGFRDS